MLLLIVGYEISRNRKQYFVEENKINSKPFYITNSHNPKFKLGIRDTIIGIKKLFLSPTHYLFDDVGGRLDI